MNQRRAPKNSAKDAPTSDKTVILKPGASEEPTLAVDARATLALKGEEARRMKEATQALPQQLPPALEPTVALPATSAAAEQTLVVSPGPSLEPPHDQLDETTIRVHQEDIAWVAGETPEPLDPDPAPAGRADPTSRMKVSFADLSMMVKKKEAEVAAARLPRETPDPPRQTAPGSEISDSTARLSRGEMDRALQEKEAGTGLVPVIQAAEQTLILRPDDPGKPILEAGVAALDTLIIKPGKEEFATAPIQALEGSGRSTSGQAAAESTASEAASTLVLKLGMEVGTAPITKPVLDHDPSRTLILKPEPEGGTVPIALPSPSMAEPPESDPTPAPESAPMTATMLLPQVETTPAQEPSTMEMQHMAAAPPALEAAPWAMVMPQQETTPALEPVASTLRLPMPEATPTPEPAPSTMLMPQQETTPAPEPVASTLRLPMPEATPTPEPAPSTMLMPQQETTPAPEPVASTLRLPMPEATPTPEPAPSTMLMPQQETTPAAEPVASTLTLPEGPPTPEPALSTMLMPQQETTPAAEPMASTLSLPMPEAMPTPEPAPSTMLMPQQETTPSQVSAAMTRMLPKVEPSAIPGRPEGFGGTVPVNRPAVAPDPPAPAHDQALPAAPASSAKATGPGGTVQLLSHEPGATASRPMDILAPPAPPISTRTTGEPVVQGTLLLPVEELSRLAEVPLEPVVEAAPSPLGVAIPYATQRMPQQKPAAPPQAPLSPSATAARPLHPPVAARPALPAAGSIAPVAPPAKGAGKRWLALAGLGVVAAVGAVLWLKPGYLGLGGEAGGRHLLPSGGSGGSAREVPNSLKSAKEKADAGDASSMRYLGTCYANGLFVPRDVEEAKRWFRRAAEAGSQSAREELAALQRQEK